jgi:8-amino-7-oxononanoate synthase
MALQDAVNSEIGHLRHQGLFRTARTVTGRQDAVIEIDGKKLLNFSSNDYLGLANHPRIKEAACDAAGKYGVGSTASPLICGKSGLHAELESMLAATTGRDRALLFSSGYMANIGLIQGLLSAGEQDVFLDRNCHASIIDGVLLSGARFRRYRHADTGSLSRLMSAGKKGKKLVLTEAVFSMDGDMAPLGDLARTCRDAGANLVVDDAHGFGVYGGKGTGSLEFFGLGQDAAPLMMATFGKALGVQGAFVAGNADLIELLVQRSRPYIYSTSMSLPNTAGAIQALRLVEAEPDRRNSLWANVEYFRKGLKEMGRADSRCTGPIQPVIIGDAESASRLSDMLEQRGLFVPCIRPPTVPKNTSRLRVTLSAFHTREHIDALLAALETSLLKLEA